MFYDYRQCPPPQVPRNERKKYFFVVLFIKSYAYNVKGQAIVFRRKSIESLMKLIYDFDQTYLHTSLENSFDKKQCCKHQNVDLLVKYTDDIQSVLNLIDPNAYIIKLSWDKNIQPHPPCPPIPPIPPPYPPYPPCPPIPPTPTPSINLTHVKITAIDGYNVTFKEYQEDGTLSEEEQTIDLTNLYENDEFIGFYPGDDCLFNGQYLIKLDPKNPDPKLSGLVDQINNLIDEIRGV